MQVTLTGRNNQKHRHGGRGSCKKAEEKRAWGGAGGRWHVMQWAARGEQQVEVKKPRGETKRRRCWPSLNWSPGSPQAGAQRRSSTQALARVPASLRSPSRLLKQTSLLPCHSSVTGSTLWQAASVQVWLSYLQGNKGSVQQPTGSSRCHHSAKPLVGSQQKEGLTSCQTTGQGENSSLQAVMGQGW